MFVGIECSITTKHTTKNSNTFRCLKWHESQTHDEASEVDGRSKHVHPRRELRRSRLDALVARTSAEPAVVTTQVDEESLVELAAFSFASRRGDQWERRLRELAIDVVPRGPHGPF